MSSTRSMSLFQRPAVLMATVIIIGLCLRAPILSVPPVLDMISEELGFTAAQAGWLNTIPVLCFGTVALSSRALTRRFGMDRVLFGMFLLLLTGIFVRTLPPVWILFAGTILLGAGIAVSNVILPSFIKREAPDRIGPLTAVYSAAISASGGIGAALTIPVMNTFDLGWREALRWPAIPVAIGILVIIPWLIRSRNLPHDGAGTRTSGFNQWRNKVSWFVSLYMGSQSWLFFATMGWLPVYLISEGMGEQRAGFLLGLSPMFGVVGSFVAPLLVHKRPDQRWLVWLSTALCASGLIGMITLPVTGTLLWVAFFGTGSGMTLSIALTYIGLRTPDASHAADLSMMSQSVGYILASTGPIIIGFAHDVIGNWQVPFALILVFIVFHTWVGLGGGKARLVTD